MKHNLNNDLDWFNYRKIYICKLRTANIEGTEAFNK